LPTSQHIEHQELATRIHGENGRITEFCKRLSGEVQLQTGEEFSIFQDRNNIAWGQQWQERINESLDVVTSKAGIPLVPHGSGFLLSIWVSYPSSFSA
jgi:hypothetical protein